MAGKFEVYEDKAGKYRFRMKAENGETVALGEAYDTLAAPQETSNNLAHLPGKCGRRQRHVMFYFP